MKKIFLIVFLVAIDQLIKYFIMINEVNKVIIDGFFRLYYIKNFGISFSFLDGNKYLILVLTLIGICFLSYLLVKFKEEKVYSIIFCCMLAGAIGNFIDRVVHGFVIDYMSFTLFGYDFAIFNFADMLLVGGGIFMIIYITIEEKRGKQIENKS